MSLLQKFEGLNYRDIRVIPQSIIFPATVGAVTAGKFTWATSTVNVLPYVSTSSFYFMDFIKVSADLDILTFQNALDFSYNAKGFSFGTKFSLGGGVGNLSTIDFADYDQLDLALGMKTNRSSQPNKPNTLQWTLKGQLDQTAEIVALGKSTINIFIRSTIYEISNMDWVAQYFESMSKEYIPQDSAVKHGNYGSFRSRGK